MNPLMKCARQRRHGRAALAPLVAVALTSPALGCASLSTTQNARTQPAGDGRFSAAAVALHARSTDLLYTVPQFELGYGRGIGDATDAGLRVWPLGLHLDVKRQLYRSPTVDVAIAPGLIAAFFPEIDLGVPSDEYVDDVSTVGVNVPLLLGLNFASGSSLIIGPKLVAGTDWQGGDMSGPWLLPGAVVGFEWVVSRRLRIHPELNAHFTIGDAPIAAREPALLLQGGVAFVID